jgi:hypothetical protein
MRGARRPGVRLPPSQPSHAARVEVPRGVERRRDHLEAARSVRELDIFLLGYMKARDDLGLPEYGQDEADLPEEFQDWVCMKSGVDTRVGWVHCVELIDDSPNNLSTFVKLFEEFLATRGRALPEPDVEQWHGLS